MVYTTYTTSTSTATLLASGGLPVYTQPITHLTPSSSLQNLDEVGVTESTCQPAATGEVVVTEGGQMAPPVTTGPVYPSYIGPVPVSGAAQWAPPAPVDWQQVCWSQQLTMETMARNIEEMKTLILQNNHMIGLLSQLVLKANRPAVAPLGKFKVERGESLDRYLQNFEEYCDATYAGGEEERLRLLEHHLEGDLLRVYLDTIRVNRSYEEVKVRLVKWFSDTMERTPLLEEAVFQEASMLPSESVGLFAMRLLDLAKRAYPGTEVTTLRTLRNKFLYGLREDLRHEALRGVMITEKIGGKALEWGQLISVVEAYTAPLTANQPTGNLPATAGSAVNLGDSYYQTPKFTDRTAQGLIQNQSANQAAPPAAPAANVVTPWMQPMGVPPQVNPYYMVPSLQPNWVPPISVPRTYAEVAATVAQPRAKGAVPKQGKSGAQSQKRVTSQPSKGQGKSKTKAQTGKSRKDSGGDVPSKSRKSEDKKGKGKKPSSTSSCSSPESSPTKKQPLQCEHCKLKGHTKRFCFARTLCLYCGNRGHQASECYIAQNKCLKCQKVGHVHKDCPRAVQSPTELRCTNCAGPHLGIDCRSKPQRGRTVQTQIPSDQEN